MHTWQTGRKKRKGRKRKGGNVNKQSDASMSVHKQVAHPDEGSKKNLSESAKRSRWRRMGEGGERAWGRWRSIGAKEITERERRVEDVAAQWQPWNLRWASQEPVRSSVLTRKWVSDGERESERENEITGLLLRQEAPCKDEDTGVCCLCVWFDERTFLTKKENLLKLLRP